ncbi:hypothetical protein [Mycolicibacterium conceptionense]|nr:hypothetical protein [Mycolicibacterium conceptionense]
MPQALRPYVTAGMAIAGASVIAVTPISAPTPQAERTIEYSSVQLSGSVQAFDAPAADAGANAIPPELSPAEAYQYVAMLTAAYVMDAIAPIVSNPTPILNQVLANQFWYANILTMGTVTGATNLLGTLQEVPEQLSTAAAQLMAGDPAAAISTVWNSVVVDSLMAVAVPLIPALEIPVAISQNIANVIAATPTMVMELGFDVLGIANNTVEATAASLRSIVEAAGSGDPTAVANAILVAPANIASGLLIGDIAEGGHNPGLINGLAKHLVLARETIAEALGAPPREIPEAAPAARAAAAEPIGVKAETVTLTAEPATTEHEATEPKATEPEAKSVVRTSPKAVPGKAGLTGKRHAAAPKLAKTISDRVTATVDKLGSNVKKALTKPDKTASTAAR